MPALRWRTANHSGNVPGQPGRPLTDPKRIPHIRLRGHVCGWCGGPQADSTRRVSRARVLCRACMAAEFGSENGYDDFIRSERARTREREKRARASAAARLRAACARARRLRLAPAGVAPAPAHRAGPQRVHP